MFNYNNIIIDEIGKQNFIKKLSPATKKKLEFLKKEIFGIVEDDIEKYLAGWLNKLKNNVCEATLSYLLGKSNPNISKDTKKFVEDFVKDRGYDAKKFRNILWKENKKEIKDAICTDSILKNLKNLLKNNAVLVFEDIGGSWLGRKEFFKIFAEYFLKHYKEFSSILDEEMKKKIDKKREVLEGLKKEIAELHHILDKVKD